MYVGKNVVHDSARGHVTGQSVYVDDIAPLHGELLVDFVWSPFAHARIKSINVDEALKVAGVAGVYTHRDLHHNQFGPIIKDEPLLAEEVCTFRGQPIVVVAAESRQALDAAKRAVRVELEELKPILTIDEAIAANSFIGDTRYIRRGDAATAMSTAEHVIEGVFSNKGQDHFYLESQAAIVEPNEDGALTVLSSTQHPTEVQEVIAHLLGLGMHQVVVTTRRMGGAFGGKESQATHPAAMAALVVQKTKRPARIVYDKDTDMHVTGKRHPFQNRYRAGFTRTGEIVALAVDLYSDGGAYADLSPAVMARAMTHAENAYFIPNIEIRKTNCYGVDTRNVTPYGQIVRNNTLPRLFLELSDRCEYAPRLKAVRDFNASSKTHLKGLSMSAVKFGISFNTKFLNQANALVNVYLDGTVQVSTGATEMGQGVNTKIRQVVADELGVSIDRVMVMITSTEKNNNTSATAASSGADLNCAAAIDACRRIRARLADVAAREIAIHEKDVEASPESIIFEDGWVWDDRRLSTRIRFENLVSMAYKLRVPMGERGFFATPRIDWNWTSGSGNPFNYFTMGTACSEVLIDRFTGELKVLRSDVLMDIGRPINPGVDRGQLVGGFIQGMGWVTTEELRYDDKGVLLSHSPTTYKIPNINDVPEVFNVDWIDHENPVNVRGSKAVGEPPLLMAISVWTAVKHALTFISNGEVPQLHLPATNEEILMRLTQYTKRGTAVA